MLLSNQNIKELNSDLLVNQYLDSGNINELLIVVPTNRRMRNLKKEKISSCPNNSSSKLNIETLTTFSTKLLKSGQSFIELSESASSILIEQAVNDVSLDYFTHFNKRIPKGTLQRIRNVISQYKRNGITPELLEKEAESLDKYERLKAVDIAKIYSSYQKKCILLKAYNIGDIYSQLYRCEVKEIKKFYVENYNEVNVIYFDGFDEFSSLELGILNKLSKLNLKIIINLDYYKYNDRIFAHLHKNIEKLKSIGFNPINDITPFPNSSYYKCLVSKLFNPDQSKNTKLKNDIFTICGRTKTEEISLIAAQIKQIILKENVQPSQICVAFNLIQDYSSTVREIFAKFGIPINLTDRQTLETSPPVVSIINLLEVNESDFYFINIKKLLNSSFIQLGNCTLSDFLNTTNNLNIISGKEKWSKRLNRVVKELARDPENDQYQIYKRTLDTINKLIELLRPFEYNLTFDEYKNNLLELIRNINISKRILDIKSDYSEEFIKGLSTFIDAIDEVFELLKNDYNHEDKFPPTFYFKILKEICNSARFNVKEKPSFGVLVTNANEIRGLKFDFLFLGGLVSGEFPSKFNPEIFMSGKYLKLESLHLAEERYHFYQSLCSWKEKMYLSYYQIDNNKETVVSNFLEEFLSAFEVSELGSDLDSNIYFTEELLKQIGRNKINEFMDLSKFHKLTRDIRSINKNILLDKKRLSNEQCEYNGILDKSIVESEKYIEKEYSVSQLENYAKCPFNFFINRILGIKVTEEPTDEIDHLELGKLIHKILYEFYTELNRENIEIRNCSDIEFKNLVEMIFQIAENNILKNEDEYYSTQVEKILGFNSNKKESILYKFLVFERYNELEFHPSFFEVSFGSIKKEEGITELDSNKPIQLGCVKLRGKIDRVDINIEDGKIKIIDYKLNGKKPTQNQLNNGLSLQLPIYLKVILELFKRTGKSFVPDDISIYSLAYNQDKFGIKNIQLKRGKVSAEEKTTLINDLMDVSIKYTNKYVKNISLGKYNLSDLIEREKEICSYCEFGSTCRKNEIKTPLIA